MGKLGASWGGGVRACGKELKDELMALLCFCGPHLEVITDVIQWEFCKTAGASEGAGGRETARGKKRGSLGLPWLECGFPITRKLFGRDSGITRCSLKPRGKDGNGGP